MESHSAIKQRWYATLLKALQTKQPADSLTRTIGDLSLREAYAVQSMLMETRIQSGERLIGWKVGATSQAVMGQLDMDEPVFGCMTSGSYYTSNREVRASEFCQLAIEAEIAFVIEKPLKGPRITGSDVVLATSGIMGAVELVDCRIRNWKINVSEAVADNALHAGVMLGPFMKPIAGLDIRKEGVVMHKNGRFLASACGGEALGDPVNVVVWLANKLEEIGRQIEPGEIILTGSLTRFHFLEPGDVVDVSFSNLGSIHFAVMP